MTAVVLAYGSEPHLGVCIESLLASSAVQLTLVIVNNGCDSVALVEHGADPRVRLLEAGTNLGYARGCNAGAAVTDDPFLVFVNSDCVVAPDAVAILTDAGSRSDVGLVTASVRFAAAPHLINSAGNPVHFLGFSWAGRCGEPALSVEVGSDVASVSGACFGVRRSVWDALGGFADEYFAYHEDVDLSLRCWLSGRRVRYVPSAVALHDYAFSRHAEKMYLLERNRLITWLTVLDRRTLLLLAPALLLAEVGTALLAAHQGWLSQKMLAWRWLLRHRSWLALRRDVVRAQRRLPDRTLSDLFTPALRPMAPVVPPGIAIAEAALATYWKVVRRWL